MNGYALGGDVSLLIVAWVLALVSYSMVVITYVSYFVFVLRNRRTKDYVRWVKQVLAEPLVGDEIPEVTAIIPMYNEESVIYKKLQNMAELDYPLEKVQVLLVDDCSTDTTCEVAEQALAELRLRGNIIRNPERMGANASYNIGVAGAEAQLILRTDADTLLSADSLRKAVRIILSDEKLGAVTGMMDPVYDLKTAATTMEHQYRSLFDRMSVAESAIHSTYPGGGGFTLIKKSVFSAIPVNKGSTDGNISLSIIRNGYRHIYVPESFSFELVSVRLGDQMRQKVRRARRVIQSTILNREILFNKNYLEFGTLIFPMKFSMFAVSPLLLFVGIFSTLFILLSYSPLLALFLALLAILIVILGPRMKSGVPNLIASVLAQQYYLAIGLFLLPIRTSIWKSMRSPRQGRSKTN